MKRNVLGAAIVYFATVFAVGFAFGTGRALLAADAPSLRLVAVVVELPLILLVSWVACRVFVRRFAVPSVPAERAMMGAIALALLLAAEAAISIGLAGRTLSEHFALYAEASHLVGLAGQIAFALLPVAQIRWP